MTAAGVATPSLQRARGAASIRWTGDGPTTVLDDLYQSGCLRVRLPRPGAGGAAAAAGQPPQAVLINTSGGLTGGDRLEVAVTAAAGTEAIVTTQACEKIYRTSAGEVLCEAALRVDDGATLYWLPQPAIVFDRAALLRSIDVRLAPTARLFALEATVLGRGAMGETVQSCRVRERWRVRSNTRLLWASEQCIEDPLRCGALPSLLAGARAAATIVQAGPDAEQQLPRLRELLACTGVALSGATCVSGVLVGLMLLPEPARLMEALTQLVSGWSGRAAPRVWSC